MKYLPQLFEQNRAWAGRRVSEDPDFFKRLCDIQQPDYVWVGCADSRVPANEIVGLPPGRLFVHRNVANVVRPDDPNCMAVVTYAVEVLRVKHIIVCGHYGCGGVRAALEGTAGGVVAEWLEPLAAIAREHREALGRLPTVEEQWAKLCEINVAEQVLVLLASDPVRAAWSSGQELTVHGWIYDLHDGLLRDLGVTVHGP